MPLPVLPLTNVLVSVLPQKLPLTMLFPALMGIMAIKNQASLSHLILSNVAIPIGIQETSFAVIDLYNVGTVKILLWDN